MKNYLWLTILFSQLAFSHDFTGHYQCEGKDSTEGSYQGEVIMNKKVEFTQEDYASYDFVLKVPGFGDYHVFAAGSMREENPMLKQRRYRWNPELSCWWKGVNNLESADVECEWLSSNLKKCEPQKFEIEPQHRFTA